MYRALTFIFIALFYNSLSNAQTQEDLKKREDQLNAEISQHPKSPDLYFYRGSVKYLSKRMDEAVKDLDSSIILWPGDSPRILRAYIYTNSYYDPKYFSLAIIDFDTLIKHHPQEAENYYYRAFCHKHLKEYTVAIKDLQSYVKINPYTLEGYDELHSNYELLGQEYKGNLEYIKGIKTMSHLIDSIKTNPEAYFIRGELTCYLYRYEGKLEYKISDAIPDLEKAISLDSTKYNYFFELGFVYDRLKKYLLARKYFEKSIALAPSSQAYQYLIGTYESLGNIKGAINISTKGIEALPNAWDLYQYRAELYAKTGDMKKSNDDNKTRDKILSSIK